MDTRVEFLIDELSTHPGGHPIDFGFWRERFRALFQEKLDDKSRISLLQAYAALLDLVERSLNSQGMDPTEFHNARNADWNILCMQEALHRSGTDLFYPDDLQEIVQREVSAGRMVESSFTKLADAGGAVLGGAPSKQEPKKNLFSRLLGRA